MSISSRIKEERQRLGVSQSVFAELAGATKSAQIKWEKGESSPTAVVLSDWALAGVDAGYIVTGLRQTRPTPEALLDIQDKLRSIRSDLLDPALDDASDGTSSSASLALLKAHSSALRTILETDAALLTPELETEARHLLDLVENADHRRSFVFDEYDAQRARRDRTKHRLSEWFERHGFTTGPAAMHKLLQISLEHGVPARTLADLVEELHSDFNSRLAATAQEKARIDAMLKPR